MRKTIVIITVSIAVIMILSGFVFASSHSKDGKENDEKPVMADNGVAGTWYLSYDNDSKKLDEAFPDIYAFGSELVIRPDGKIYWHIGAAGAAGTYEAYGNQMTACVADIMEPDEYRIAITKSEDGKLLMKYKAVPLEWTYGSQAY